jgi:ketosteroid isomerase-like protein
MPSENEESAEAIRSEIAARVEAVRTKDVFTLMSHYALEVLTFDVVTPLSNLGAETVRERVVAWFESFEGLIDYELADVKLSVAGDVAFDSHLTHVRGKNRESGQMIDMWFRETIGYRKLDGAWKVVHQHSSVPFDMTDGKARLDLTP